MWVKDAGAGCGAGWCRMPLVPVFQIYAKLRKIFHNATMR